MVKSITHLKNKTTMKKGTQVKIELSLSDAVKLGMSKAISGVGEIISEYKNGVDGYFIKFNGRTIGIASRYNAITLAG